MFPAGIPISKRLFDLSLTTLGIILISPILLILALTIRLALGSPILFKQKRPGYLSKPFLIYKFRSMS